MNKNNIDKSMEISEKFFQTEFDPDQIPVNNDSERKLLSIHKHTIIFKNEKGGDLVAWVVIIPTSISTMNKFLNKKITEKELLEMAVKEKNFDALYLCSIFVIPEYRRKGYAKKLIIEAIEKLQSNRNAPLYCWVYSEEGEKLISNLSETLNRPILKLKK